MDEPETRIVGWSFRVATDIAFVSILYGVFLQNEEIPISEILGRAIFVFIVSYMISLIAFTVGSGTLSVAEQGKTLPSKIARSGMFVLLAAFVLDLFLFTGSFIAFPVISLIFNGHLEDTYWSCDARWIFTENGPLCQ